MMNSNYLALNALAKIEETAEYEQRSVENYLETQIKGKLRVFETVRDKYSYLVDKGYYERQPLNLFTPQELKELQQLAHSFEFKFQTLVGCMKFYETYALKSDDNLEILETYEDRVVANAILMSAGDFETAKVIIKNMMSQVYQPATPSFLNALRVKRGEYVSCYLLRTEDNMESIASSVSNSLQLSKRGGGVAVNLTNIREFGAKIKDKKGASTGVIPVMKILEDVFTYSNQLGQRQGAGAVYLNAHHPDVLKFLDTKRENADEKIRIKTLSLGLILTNIIFEKAKANEDYALFSPQDILTVYGKPMSDISLTKEYYNILANSKIKKTFISARKLFSTIAELHFESGYPYLLFDDVVNDRNPLSDRIVMSNLCSEILQPSTLSTFNEDGSYKTLGNDISCNLGSINIAKSFDFLETLDFETQVFNAIQNLTFIAKNTNLNCSPTIKKGNSENLALGLGAMNLHGFLANSKIHYDSEEALDFVNIWFYTLVFYAFKASCKLAQKDKTTFLGFETSKYKTGEYFLKYTNCKEEFVCKTEKVRDLLEQYEFYIPTKNDWISLVQDIKVYGLRNSHLLAVAPTGSISYLSSCTPSLQPVVSSIETRKEGKLGRLYVPAYNLNPENIEFYKSAFDIPNKAIIDVVSTAQQHVSQGISLTLFANSDYTTRDLIKDYVYAFSKQCTAIYYVRVRQPVLEGTETYDFSEIDDCKSCQI